MKKTIFRSDFIAVMLAVVFIAFAYHFLSVYNRCLASDEMLETMRIRMRLMHDQKLEYERKQGILNLAQGFIEKAKDLGLDEENWSRLTVNVEEKVFFTDVERVVNQSLHSPTYYFQPISLHLKTGPGPADDTADGTGRIHPAGNPEDGEGDVNLTLKGAFLVRQNPS